MVDYEFTSKNPSGGKMFVILPAVGLCCAITMFRNRFPMQILVNVRFAVKQNQPTGIISYVSLNFLTL
jgi:hypothetical protein